MDTKPNFIVFIFVFIYTAIAIIGVAINTFDLIFRNEWDDGYKYERKMSAKHILWSFVRPAYIVYLIVKALRE